MRASLASLLLTTFVLSTTTAYAGPKGKKKAPRKKAPKKQVPAETTPAPEAPAPTPDPPKEGTLGGDPATGGQPAPTGTGGLGGGTTPASSTTLGGTAPAPPAPPAPSAPPTPSGPVAPAPPPTAEAKAKAKALVKEATKLYNVQQYEKAADLYQQAYLLDQNPAYLYASAQSQRLGGDCTKALQSYQAYLRANPPETERAKAEANIERCQTEIKEREAAVNAEQIQVPYDVPAPPPPPPEEPPPPPPPPPPEKSYVFGHVLLGAGLIAIGGGSYLFYDGRKTLQDHNSAATYDEYLAGRSGVEDAQTKQKVGLIAVGSGVALVSGAILFYVLHSKSSEEAPPPVQANVSAQGATLTFTRNF